MVDTEVLRRIRDELLEKGRPSMGLGAPPIDGLTPYELAALERVGPLVELLVLVMTADGHAHERESDAVRGVVRALTDGLLRGHAADRYVVHCRELAEREGFDTRLFGVLDQLAHDRDDAESAVLLVGAVVLADDEVDARERALFEQITGELGVSPKRLDALLGRA